MLADSLHSRRRLHIHYSNLKNNYLADCDADDNVGCAAGLTCGEDNCAQFHDFGEATGFNPSSDCCEGKTPSAIEIELFGQALNTLAVVVVATVIYWACIRANRTTPTRAHPVRFFLFLVVVKFCPINSGSYICFNFSFHTKPSILSFCEC